MEVSEDRLQSIEKKLDRLTEVISSLAVVDERITNLIANNSAINIRIRELEKATSQVSTESTRHDVIITRLERLIWILVAGLSTAWIKLLFGT